MGQTGKAVHEVHRLEQLAARDQWVNRIHPLVKFFLTVGYLAVTVSFPAYDLAGTAGMAVYPLALLILADLSFRDTGKRLRLVLPFVLLIGLGNLFFDRNLVQIGGFTIRAGVVSMAVLFVKGTLCVLASYLLIATTSMEKLCYAFGILHFPKAVITQFLLTWRYLTLLLEEVNRMTDAYALRAPGQKGIRMKAWGSLAGQLLLRSMDRADGVYESMLLRGYRGDYAYIRETAPLRGRDAAWLLFWGALFVLFRRFPVLYLAGAGIGGLLS